MSKRAKKGLLIACVAVIPLAVIAKISFLPVIYPTKSSSQQLSIVSYSGFYPNKPVITLSHYVNDQHIGDYILTIDNGVSAQDPQKYDLPELIEGTIEVNVNLEDKVNSSFDLCYQASDLYENGLLIYLTTNGSAYSLVDGENYYDRYVYFVSGENKICYFKESFSSEWSIVTNAPSLKKIPKKYDGAYIPWDSGWEENEWVVKEIDN